MGDPLVRTLRRPKQVALLTMLAVAPAGLRTRDRLLATFWPDSPDAKARHALNQSLHEIRTELGPVVTREGELLGIEEGALTSDAAELRAAADSRDHARVVELYRGDFLDGLFLSDTHHFQRWVDTERAELRALAAASHWEVAEELAGADRLAEAGALARRGAELSPGDEVALRKLLTFLDTIGDRIGAMAAFDQFAGYMREEFEVDPAPETVRLHEEIRDRAHVRVPALPPVDVAPSDQRTITPSTSPDTTQPDTRSPLRRRDGRAAAVGVLGALLALAAVWIGSWDAARSLEGAVRVGFLRTPDAEAEGVAARLSEVLFEAAELELAPATASGLSLTWAEADGESVDLLVSVTPGSETTPWTAVQVFDVESREVVGLRRFEAGTDPRLLSRYVRQTAGSWALTLGHRADPVSEWATDRLAEAERLRADGERHLRGTRAPLADRRFREADSVLSMVSDSAPDWPVPRLVRGEVNLSLASTVAWLNASDTTRILHHLDVADSLASHVLAEIPTHPEALELRGRAGFTRWDALFPDSADLAARTEADLNAAVAAYPQLSTAWQRLGELRYWAGNYPEAYVAADQAVRLDPFARSDEEARALLMRSAAFAYDTTTADRECREGLLLIPDSPTFQQCDLFLRAWGLRPAEVETFPSRMEALDTVPILRPLSPLRMSYWAGALAQAGLADSARSVIERGRHAEPTGALPAALIEDIRVLAVLGDTAAALEQLRWLVDTAPHLRSRIARAPQIRGLRGHPDFEAVLRDAGGG